MSDPSLEVTGCDEAICAAEVRIVGAGPKALVVRHCTTCHAWDSHVACANCGACITGKEYQRHAKPSFAAAIATFRGAPEPPLTRYCSLRCCRAADKAEREADAERDREWDAKAKESRVTRAAERDRRLALRDALRETSSRPIVAPTSVTELVERVKAARTVNNPRNHPLWWLSYIEDRLAGKIDEAPCGRCERQSRYDDWAGWHGNLCVEHAWNLAENHLSTCEVCGREFVQRTAWSGGNDWHPEREGVVRYCDDVCRGVANSERARAERAESRNGLTCEVCGEALDRSRKDARFCSSACRQKAYRVRTRDREREEG